MCWVNEGKCTRIAIDSPPISICSGEKDIFYTGTAEGSVWKIENEKKQLLLTGKKSVVLAECKINAVMGVHLFNGFLISVFIHGEITIYNLAEKRVETIISVDNVITQSICKEELLICAVGRNRVEIYDLKKRCLAKRYNLLDNASVISMAFMDGEKKDAFACGSASGKVSVFYLSGKHRDYVFKAHKKETENEEIFFPVTFMQAIGDHKLITGGAEGALYLWDIQTHTRLKCLYTTEKAILYGEANCSKEKIESIALVLGPTIESAYLLNDKDKIEISILSSESINLYKK